LSVWQSAVLAYASGKCGVTFTSIEQTDKWLLSFGECVDCESQIGPKRLSAVPWASRCIRCQEAADRQEREDAGGTLVNAA
jgi:hypothetical protein